MIGAPIPQDILKYEPKLVGHFTARQTIIVGLGVGLALVTDFKLLPASVPYQTKGYIAFVILALFFIWSKAKPFGQPLEKVIVPILQDNIFKSSIRVKEYERSEHERKFKEGLTGEAAKKSKKYKSY